MKKITIFLKEHTFIGYLMLLIIFLLLNLILYIFNLRFTNNVFYIVSIIFVLSLFVKTFKEKWIYGVVGCVIGIIISFIILDNLLVKEYIVEINDKKYIAIIDRNSKRKNINLYEKKGILVRIEESIKLLNNGNLDILDKIEIKEHINNWNVYDFIIYDRGISSYKRNGQIMVNDREEIVIEIFDDINIDPYVLAEDMKVLYEKKIGDKIIRFSLVDNVLGQSQLIAVVKSVDNGENYYIISKDYLKVSLNPKFEFIDENVGFAINNGQIRLQDSYGMFVTIDGGENFVNAYFEYENNLVQYIDILDIPYEEENILKLDASIYVIDNDKGYIDKKVTFISKDRGLNWQLEK